MQPKPFFAGPSTGKNSGHDGKNSGHFWGVKESQLGIELRFSALFLWLYKAEKEIGLIVDILRHPSVKFLSQLIQTSSQYSGLEHYD